MVLKQNLSKTLAPGFMARPVTVEDAQIIADLINTWSQHFIGRDTEDVNDIRRQFDEPKWKPETATRLIFNPEGEAVAYAEIWDIHSVPVIPHLWLAIHPHADYTTYSGYLMNWAIERSRQVIDRVPENARVVFETTADARDPRFVEIFLDAGLESKDQSWLKMAVKMDAPPPAPVWPEGIRLISGDDLPDQRPIFEAVRNSFRDHRGFVEGDIEEDFERWMRRHEQRVETGEFDPSLWFLAMNDDTIVSLVLGKDKAHDNPDQAYINTVGTLPKYRGRGLALALMQQAMRTFWERGRKEVALHVDGSSITGATRLYEKLGMSEEERYQTYFLELRPGEELSTQ